MGDIMRPVPFSELIERIVGEYRNHRSIFGIAEEHFYRTSGAKPITIFGQACDTALGPAAGPHTQLAQNIVASYLVGGRFIELKTVQILDELEIEKPCIDARDEGYNTEWSSEYTLTKAWDEYAKAWIILHLLEAVMGDGTLSERPSFIFNMSVGYNLEGIKSERMQQFIDTMIDGSGDERFACYLIELQALINEGLFVGTPWEEQAKGLDDLPKRISAKICNSTTLSTMHGCPPDEIEAICSYMMQEKGVHTYVKLNPTLLGYEAVREILDTLGYQYITLKEESFTNDLQWKDAVAMLERLVAIGEQEELEFGVKLTNTLGAVNDQGVLPGEEMYMSGRALLPLSTTVGARLSEAFGGKLPISYSGGATAFTVQALYESGIRPITVATDLLKPGGYARLKQLVEIVEASDGHDLSEIDTAALDTLATAARAGTYASLDKAFRGKDSVKLNEPLPMWDCYVAPCVE
ncbi:MAG TPA: putative selenate reductase subunit YgfK, partial [Sphaerochaeta sp.]|nr:putative selenate reductase subunit YgfK [Sphaerochaeta sp.]